MTGPQPATAPQSLQAVLRCRLVAGLFWLQTQMPGIRPGPGISGAPAGRAAAAAGMAEVAAAAASAARGPAGVTADMIAGITMPLSRSMAWPAPSWFAMLLRSPKIPVLPPVAAGAASDGSPSSG